MYSHQAYPPQQQWGSPPPWGSHQHPPPTPPSLEFLKIKQNGIKRAYDTAAPDSTARIDLGRQLGEIEMQVLEREKKQRRLQYGH
tara:strand:+ start:361 stop:615 length:255 start_codon:yes stop_codon:yes gene_type:complete